MATKYKVIINTAKEAKIVEAITPESLATKIVPFIPKDPRDDVEVVFELNGPLSRRVQTES